MRRRRGTAVEDGIFDVCGTLDGVRPGRGVVRHLHVRRLPGDTAEGLRPLAQFRDLRILELEEVSSIDLAPLAELRLTHLYLRYFDRVDLSRLADLEGLDTLLVGGFRDSRVPERLTLSGSLRALAIDTDAPWSSSGEPVKRLVEAIDWRGLAGLRELMLRVGGMHGLPPVELDLAFLRHLHGLQLLRFDVGVSHAGSGPSPLEPPFDGLPKSLQHVAIDAWNVEVVRERLREYLGPGAQVSVLPRSAPPADAGEWRLEPPARDDPAPAWSTYGSLCELLRRRDASADMETEYEALDQIVSELRAHDPALLGRLEFDPESAGTGVSAPTRRDLERVLQYLGTTPSKEAG